jgi:hypothetical protein
VELAVLGFKEDPNSAVGSAEVLLGFLQFILAKSAVLMDIIHSYIRQI